jgi:large subunit ribosomal protein L4
VELPAAIFGQPLHSHLLYENVKMQLANRRAGTHATKTRAFVSGGGKKPWKQKGTGRARAGSSRSPIWVGGAAVFGPQPRDYSYRIPNSARRRGLCVALSAKNREQRLLVVERLEVPSGKTKDMAKALKSLGVTSALLVVATRDEGLERSARNLPGVKVIMAGGLNVYDVLRYEHLVLTAEALSGIEERLAE